MSDQEIKELIERYNANTLTDGQRSQLEQRIEQGHIQLSDLKDIQSIDDKLQHQQTPEPSAQMDTRFYNMLHEEEKKLSTPGRVVSFRAASWMRWAAVGVLFLVGVAVGRYYPTDKGEARIEILSEEIAELREMMMLSLLEKDAATERLRAVSLTQEMDHVSVKVTEALLETLNHDENINVRLAALEALIPYAKQDTIREELIRSIARQTSPLVQVALAELMVALQEKSSVDELRKLLQNENTPPDVKDRIHKNIETLI